MLILLNFYLVENDVEERSKLFSSVIFTVLSFKKTSKSVLSRF